jgi:hypothetical protein
LWVRGEGQSVVAVCGPRSFSFAVKKREWSLSSSPEEIGGLVPLAQSRFQVPRW